MQIAYPIVNVTGLAADAIVVDNSWRNYVPRVVIVGAGAAPNYVTNQGRYMVTNNVVRCDIFLNGNGGTAGSGAGTLSVTLPVLPSIYTIGVSGWFNLGGYMTNGGNNQALIGRFTVGSPLLELGGWPNATSFAALTGADQNNANRTIQAHFWYETSSILL